MTRDEVICMAREAGFATSWTVAAGEALERFTALVAAAEREACAKMCDNYDIRAKTSDGWIVLNEAQRVSSELATKIRARSEV